MKGWWRDGRSAITLREESSDLLVRLGFFKVFLTNGEGAVKKWIYHSISGLVGVAQCRSFGSN